MIVHRCFPWDAGAEATSPGGALWFPRRLQGDGRHDAPGRYGCLYASEVAVSAVAEELARFVGTELAAADLRRGGLPLALATLVLDDSALLVDLDEPLVLAAERLRPSLVAARERPRTQDAALALFERHIGAAGVRWWSALDSRWANVTLFDRARAALSVEEIGLLRLSDDVVEEAASFLGLRAAA
ncbi:MAG: RES family NAD+ phosphorylase [Gaiellaceae bacterium]